MKSLLITCIMVASLSSIAQKRSSFADAKLGQIVMTDLHGNQIDADALGMDQVVKLRIPVSNINDDNTLPAGSARIKIGFGSKLQLDPAFNMNNAGLNSYFHWTASTSTGQLLITGDLINEMPEGMQNIEVAFKVKGSAIGRSTITANFLISNHNTTTVLSDLDPNNNVAFLQYNVMEKSRPVSPIRINEVAKSNCAVNVVFSTDTETNISRFDIEVSKDGISYVKVGEVNPTNQLSYTTSFALTTQLQVMSLMVRVKSVDMEGNYKYSQPSTVNSVCDKNNGWSLNVYPNPVTDVRSVMISTTEGTFKGKYKISLIDVTGQLIQATDMQLDNVTNFRYNFGVIASSKYLIQIVNSDGSQTGVLKFEKL